MKIRNGYVSNSSASSFIVAFPCLPATVKELHYFLFEKPYVFETRDGKASTDEISHVVFDDIKIAKIVENEESLVRILETHGAFPGLENEEWEAATDILKLITEKMSEEEAEKIVDQYLKVSDEVRNKAAKKLAKEFFENIENQVVFLLYYHYEKDGIRSLLENSDLFGRLHHIKMEGH